MRYIPELRLASFFVHELAQNVAKNTFLKTGGLSAKQPDTAALLADDGQ